MQILKKTYALLSGRERSFLYLLMSLTIILACLEMVSIGAVSPLLMVMADPEKIHEVNALAWIYEAFGFSSSTSFMIFLAVVAIALTAATQAFAYIYTWAQVTYLQRRMYALTLRMLSHYLHQPYAFFLNRNSSDLSKNILVEARRVVSDVLTPLLTLITSATTTLAVLILLLSIDPGITLVSIVIFGGGYSLIYTLTRREVLRLGKRLLKANTQRFKYATEAFSGIKEIRILGSERRMLAMFKAPAAELEQVTVRVSLIRQLPKYALQLIAYVGVITIAILLVIIHEGDLSTVLPVLGVFAFASFRLMPKFQSMFTSLTTMRYAAPVVNSVYEEISSGDMRQRQLEQAPHRRGAEPITISQSLVLHDIEYTYPRAPNPTLNGVSLTIAANETVGFMGTTGSGKSTLADIMLGLLEPQRGKITIDGHVLGSHNVRSWMDHIGYVPQHIFLADDSVARNIAFGVSPSLIDLKVVRWAARIANIDNFVIKDMPNGYDTEIGEGGIRLSGGQRQRIGIARALYRNPSLLLLDEATSALDSTTENAVMEAINELTGTRTIIIIAHRISTLSACARIYELRAGSIVRSGTYADMFQFPLVDGSQLANATPHV